MLALGRRVPDVWSLVERARATYADEIGGPYWPSHCYLPLEIAASVAAETMRRDGVQPTPSMLAHHASVIATLAAWRMTQGIYRYDPSLYPALIDTKIDGELPAEIISYLPEWCVYIETPDMSVCTTAGLMPLRGAFVWIDRARAQRHDILAMTLDVEGAALTITHVPLIGTMQAAIANVAEEWRGAYQRGNSPTVPPDEYETEAVRVLTPLMSLVLYLCTEAADITGKRGAPANPTPVRTRRHGLRLFAANGPTTWDVGVRLGAALRRAYQKEQFANEAESEHSVRPHVRRAHWHTFISGPRNNRPLQRRVPKWLPPIPVGISDYDAVPAVIRGVE